MQFSRLIVISNVYNLFMTINGDKTIVWISNNVNINNSKSNENDNNNYEIRFNTPDNI